MEAEKIEFKTEEEWLKFRKGGLGGNDAPIVLGVSQYAGPLDLYAVKSRLVEDKSQTELMAWGKRLQKPLKEGYEEETQRLVMDQGIHTFVNKKYDFMRYSTDGLIPMDPPNGNPWIFEAKCTGYLTVKDLAEDFPLAWEVQVQHGLFTLGLQKASFAILVNGNKLLWKDIDRNDSFIEQMVEKEMEFWERVKSGTPPDADYRESTKDTISKLYPKDTGTTVKLPNQAAAWDEVRSQATDAIKKWQEHKDEAENKLRMAIGDATFGTLPNGQSFTWKWQERKGYEVKATEFRVLRRKGK